MKELTEIDGEKISSPLQKFYDDLQQYQEKIKVLLHPGIKLEQFTRSIMIGLQTSSMQDRLLGASRKSLFFACERAARYGLMPDGKEGFLNVFFNKKKGVEEVQFIPMIEGILRLAYESGIKKIDTHIVYEKDVFTYNPGVDQIPHVTGVAWFEDRGAPIGAAAWAVLKNCEYKTEIMTKKQILDCASIGRNAEQYHPHTGKFFDRWWAKTVIKQLIKKCPLTGEKGLLIQEILDEENRVENQDE